MSSYMQELSVQLELFRNRLWLFVATYETAVLNALNPASWVVLTASSFTIFENSFILVTLMEETSCASSDSVFWIHAVTEIITMKKNMNTRRVKKNAFFFMEYLSPRPLA